MNIKKQCSKYKPGNTRLRSAKKDQEKAAFKEKVEGSRQIQAKDKHVKDWIQKNAAYAIKTVSKIIKTNKVAKKSVA